MFFNSIKGINRLRKEINSLLSKGMSFIQLKKNYRLRKEINRSRSAKYLLKIYYCKKLTFSKRQFSKYKKFVTMSVKLTQISLNFKTSCCNLKIRGLGAKLCVAFLLF